LTSTTSQGASNSEGNVRSFFNHRGGKAIISSNTTFNTLKMSVLGKGEQPEQQEQQQLHQPQQPQPEQTPSTRVSTTMVNEGNLVSFDGCFVNNGKFE